MIASPVLLVLGVALLGLGVLGVGFADRIVEAQAREGMAPLQDAPVDEADRIVATKGAGAVLLLVGLGLIALGIVGW